MNVVLIGYRGCGKSTIGRQLADRMWWKFADLDEMIVRSAGRSIADIFQKEGEERFRDLETDSLREALKLEEHVLALGGGAPMREENRRLLRASQSRIIYLHCEPQVLWQRIQQDANSAVTRPPLTGLSGADEVLAKLAEREPVYRQLMHKELDVTNLTPQDAVVYLARMI